MVAGEASIINVNFWKASKSTLPFPNIRINLNGPILLPSTPITFLITGTVVSTPSCITIDPYT